MGIIFISMSVFVILPLIITISAAVIQPYEKYDFEAINKNGKVAEATVTSVEPMTNVSVNGQHPIVVAYTYTEGGSTVSDKFQTFDLEKAGNLNTGDTLAIKVYNGESAIVAMDPYSFPVYLFLLMPVPFFLVGTVFLLIALIPALKKYRLYKTGIVKDAEIVSMAPHSMGLRTVHQHRLLVNYFFTGRNGAKVFGECVTDEYSLLHEKKSGDGIKIFVAQDDETKSCLIPRMESLKYNWNI